MTQQIVLRDLEPPARGSVDDDIEWVCDVLNLASGRDTERISPHVLRLLFERGTPGGLTAEEIAQEMGIETQRVQYHVRSLVKAGVVQREKRKVWLRQGSVAGTVEEVRRDAERIFENLGRIAQDIDGTIGLERR